MTLYASGVVRPSIQTAWLIPEKWVHRSSTPLNDFGLRVRGSEAEDINWPEQIIFYRRRKTDAAALIHFGSEVAAILKALPQQGPLFPYLIRVRACDRATEFKQRCESVGISGVTLHS